MLMTVSEFAVWRNGGIGDSTCWIGMLLPVEEHSRLKLVTRAQSYRENVLILGVKVKGCQNRTPWNDIDEVVPPGCCQRSQV